MDSSKPDVPYQISVENFTDSRLPKVKVMVCQLNFDRMTYDKGIPLCFVKNNDANRAYLRRLMSIAANQKVDLIVFPELTINGEFVDEMLEYAKSNDTYIVAGTHYKQTGKGYVSICPIVTPRGVFNTEKIAPSPFEQSSFSNGIDGAIPGKSIRVFRGTKIGDFAVMICLDYTNDKLRDELDKDNLDFIIVSAFNSKSDEFFYTMHSDVQRSQNGLYVIYCNVYSEKLKGEGRSALFAFMSDIYKSEFKDRNCSDLTPPNKIYEFAKDKEYCIFEVDMLHKKPYISKNTYSETNVRVILEDDAKMEEIYKFQKAINATEDKYIYIDKFYVKPKEYEEMIALLERENVLIITGDPGIGKTYTAIRILLEYHKKGLHPLWFYGIDKEDRDKQKEQLLNFEPNAKDIVYLEDPFGRTVFENREELKTLFANWVDRFKGCKAKLIISSRAEVFKQFEKEVVSSEILEDYQKELNIRKPSYNKKDLKDIASVYIDAFASWANDKKLRKIIAKGIDKEQLISPLMIYNLVMNHSQPTDAKTLVKAITEAKNRDLVTQFAEEIKILSHPAKILIYLVLLYGRKNIALIRESFEKVQIALFDKYQFESSSFAYELRCQEGHRIQRLGEMIPVYRLSHPTYEEALIKLAMKNSQCSLIAETCVKTIISLDNSIAVELFRRYIMRYPDFLEKMLTDVLIIDFDNLSEYVKLDLTRKMLLSDSHTFQENAKKMFPMEKLIQTMSDDNEKQLFVLQLSMLNKRKKEVCGYKIEWKQIFTAKRITGMHPSLFLYCCSLAIAIDRNLIIDIEENLQKTDLVRKFILLSTEVQRNQLNDILSGTEYTKLYDDIKSKIPDDILGERITKRKYSSVLKKYILKKEKPKGEVCIDDGAMNAMRRGAKLYPIGVISIDGDFAKGDIVYIISRSRRIKILAMIEMSSDEIDRFKGLHSSEIYEMTGEMTPTVISRPYFREHLYSRRFTNNP